MNFEGIEICCPSCGGDLRDDGRATREFHCVRCVRTYPVVLGIPDLRLADDPYIDRQADVAKGLKIAERLADTDFAGLVAHYYSMTPAVPMADAIRYTRGLLAAEVRAHASLEAWRTASDGPAGGDRFLDLGCGTAPLMTAARSRFDRVCGVDIAFRWLVIAKKRLESAGVQAPLICACAEHLPFCDEQFDQVSGESVLENVQDQERTLAVARRVLRPGGRLAFSLPNRFSLGPDPHVGLWAGGYLPERLLAGYVRRRGGVPPRRRLLSALRLGRMLRTAGFASVRIFLPDIAEAQRRQLPVAQARLVGLYQTFRRLPLSRELLFLFGPLLHAVARKSAGSVSADPSQAALPRSDHHGEHATIG